MAELIKEASRRAEVIITSNRKSLDKLAEALVKAETLGEEEVNELLKDAKLPKEAALY